MLADRKYLRHARDLQHHAELTACGDILRITTEERGRTRAGTREAGQQPDDSRFAGAIRPQQCGDLAGEQRQVYLR